MNRSRWKRGRLPPKPEFGWGTVAVGIFAGIAAGTLWKVMRGGPVLFVMTGGGIVGLMLGLAVAALRFSRGQRRFRAARTGNQRS